MRIAGWECFAHPRVAFPQRTTERMKITHGYELLGLCAKHNSEGKLFVGRGTLSKAELKILLCYWDE